MISCIIVEDQPPAQRVLKKYITDLGTIELKNTFGDALSALEFLKTNQIDLIFLDIHLPKISGIDFLNILTHKPKIILTTAFSEYALQGYELDIVDYLLKPFSFERFVKAVSKVNPIQNNISVPQENSTQKNTNDFIFVKSGYDYVKILFSDIQHIKSEGDYTNIFTKNAKYLVSYSLKYWNEKLPSETFCQVHKSYLINISHLDKISGNQLFIGKEKIPIGRAFRDKFFNNYLEN